jgi:hypothetical protein
MGQGWSNESATRRAPPSWLNRTVLGISLASLFSDWSHEIATAILPTFLGSLGAIAAWLGIIEGVSDGLSSFAKLGSGFYTDGLSRRKPIAFVGYLITTLAHALLLTSAMHCDFPSQARRAYGRLVLVRQNRDGRAARCAYPGSSLRSIADQRHSRAPPRSPTPPRVCKDIVPAGCPDQAACRRWRSQQAGVVSPNGKYSVNGILHQSA